MNLKDILTGGITGLVKEIKNTVDEFHMSKEEKAEFSLRVEELAQKKSDSLAQQVLARYEAVTRIIQAEMAQGDKFTKRARPSVVYWGLVMFTVNIVAQFWGIQIVVPQEFVLAWSSVVAIWSIGRSAEKVTGKKNIITGKSALPEL